MTKLKEGIKVLDSASGPGCWSLDMAKEFPSSSFHGIDMTAHDFSNTAEKLANFEFTVGNLLEGLPFEDNTFDYIYQRLLFLGLNDEGWATVLNELLRVLKPGGYIELLEVSI
jgi:ubiquinone/menaquinone biosynthesis C-methylase UbiE